VSSSIRRHSRHTERADRLLRFGLVRIVKGEAELLELRVVDLTRPPRRADPLPALVPGAEGQRAVTAACVR